MKYAAYAEINVLGTKGLKIPSESLSRMYSSWDQDACTKEDFD